MKDILTTKEAAELLGYKAETLEVSRTRGELAGVTAPVYIKMGRNVRYRRDDLDCWLSQFDKLTKTDKNQ